MEHGQHVPEDEQETNSGLKGHANSVIDLIFSVPSSLEKLKPNGKRADGPTTELLFHYYHSSINFIFYLKTSSS